MPDDITFIKDKTDYNNYRQLKPASLYKTRKIKFICTICNKESVKTFKSLKIPFICKHCTNRLAQLNPDTRKKVHDTFLKNYGEPEILHVKEIREKIKTTVQNKYGVDNISQLDNIKQQKIKTLNTNYGVDSPLQSKIIQQRLKESVIKKFGVSNVFQSELIKEQIKSNNVKNYGVEYITQLDDYKQKSYETKHEHWIEKYSKIFNKLCLTLLTKDDTKFVFKCNICNETFSFSYAYLYVLLKTQDSCFCPNCSRIKHNGYSFMEKEIFNFIRTVYNDEIFENDRNVLNGKEIDIYLPKLKLGFEFDGTYWHADSRFYNPNDLIKNKTAQKIWEKDVQKNILCENLGINLVRIKEYDWLTDKTVIKYQILSAINNRKHEYSLFT